MINIGRVERTWDILNRATRPLTYADLARRLGYSKRQRAGLTVWKYLWVVGEYCTRRGWPCLNALVVKKDTGKPGEGVILLTGSVTKDQRRVLEGPSRQPPTAKMIARIWADLHPRTRHS
jgi:hypothetical protein